MSESEEKTDYQEKLTNAAVMLQSVAKPFIAFVTFIAPIIISTTQTAYNFYCALPLDAVTFLLGFVFCFFGGMYPTLFAAVQAAKHSGRKTVVEACGKLAEEVKVIIEENEKDDKKDDDGDGVADVDQIDGKALMMRKANLVMTKINPIKVSDAIESIGRVWISVLATLTLEFARTISLSLTISEFLKKPVDRFIAPTLQLATPKGYKRWVPVILTWICKSIAMSIAWYIQTIISAFTSALEGGLIMARTVQRICVKKGLTFFGMIPEKHEDTNLDEILSYLLAAGGFYFQFKLGFDMPFPFDWLLWPFELAEYYIRWTITK